VSELVGRCLVALALSGHRDARTRMPGRKAGREELGTQRFDWSSRLPPHFFTSGHPLASSGLTALSGEIVATVL